MTCRSSCQRLFCRPWFQSPPDGSDDVCDDATTRNVAQTTPLAFSDSPPNLPDLPVFGKAIIEAMSQALEIQSAPDILQRLVKPLRPAERRRVPTPDIPMIEGLGDTMTAFLKKLTAADANTFQTLQLEGLANYPCEFGTAYEEEVDLALDVIVERLEEGMIFGAFVDGCLQAIAGFRRFDRQKKQHKAELFGVYVAKDARGLGLGEAIVRHVVDQARGEVEQLLATVASLNQPAKVLYAKLGFEAFGHEPRAHKVGDRYFDQDHLVLMLA